MVMPAGEEGGAGLCLPALGGSQTAANGRQEWAKFGYMHLSLCNRVALTGRGLGQDRNEAAGVNNEHLAWHTFFVCSRVGSPTGQQAANISGASNPSGETRVPEVRGTEVQFCCDGRCLKYGGTGPALAAGLPPAAGRRQQRRHLKRRGDGR